MRIFSLLRRPLKRKVFTLLVLCAVLYFLSLLYELTPAKKVSIAGPVGFKEQLEPLIKNRIFSSLNNTKKQLLHPRNASFCPKQDILESKEVIIAGEKFLKQKKVFTFGIPTVTRYGSVYLKDTVKSLIENLSPKDMKEVVIVIFLADFEREKKDVIANEMLNSFSEHFQSGLLRLIQAPKAFYPTLENLKKRFGDSEKRIYWRSKQSIDFAFLFCYCQHLSTYYINLEDDIIAAPLFVPRLKEFVSSDEEWFTLDASSLGYIGKVYHSSSLDQIASFFMVLYDEMPVDWLQNIWRDVKGKIQRWHIRPYGLFKHIGYHSSLKGKIMNLSEKYFDVNTRKYEGKNPPGKVTTNMLVYEGSPQQAYDRGSGYFWAKGPVASQSHVMVELNQATKLHRLAIDTGCNYAHNDFLHTGIVQVAEAESGQCKDFKYIGDFVNGTFAENTDFPYPVKCIKILTQKEQEQWLYFWGINIWPDDELK